MSRLKDGECAWEEDIERERERRTRAGSGREEKNTRGLTGRKGWGGGEEGRETHDAGPEEENREATKPLLPLARKVERIFGCRRRLYTVHFQARFGA